MVSADKIPVYLSILFESHCLNLLGLFFSPDLEWTVSERVCGADGLVAAAELPWTKKHQRGGNVF